MTTLVWGYLQKDCPQTPKYKSDVKIQGACKVDNVPKAGENTDHPAADSLGNMLVDVLPAVNSLGDRQ